MTDTSLLSVSHLSKKYCRSLRRSLWYGVKDTARELLPFAAETPGLRSGEFWALDDVSFDVKAGSSVAIIGHNGAGKSTLLKILYGLLKPDRGEVRIRGRCEALIELGTGFNPLLSGRENVRVGAALHGLDHRQTAELLEKVVDFAELDAFIDSPLQSYSSGMKARLSFALAASLSPDVLLVDEVLAVGDLAFQRKCAGHIRSYLAAGGSLIFVSHNTYQIQSLCEEAILLDHGRIVFRGTSVDTLNLMFERAHTQGGGALVSGVKAEPARIGPIVIDEIVVEPLEGDVLQTGAAARITICYDAEAELRITWGFGIWTDDQWVCVTGEYDLDARVLKAGKGELSCTIPNLPLVGGRYWLRAAIMDAETQHPLAMRGWQDAAALVRVRSDAALDSNAQMTMNQLVRVDVIWS